MHLHDVLLSIGQLHIFLPLPSVLPIVSYGYETWSLIYTGNHEVSLSVNMMLSTVVPTGHESKAGRRKLHKHGSEKENYV
jgi:hypothetical protein